MNKEIKNYLENTLNKVAILDETNVAFEQIEILAYNTHYENGDAFMHQNGDTYALAILNAITQESSFKIARFLKKEKNLSVKNIEDFVEGHFLKCYVSGNSEEYNLWKTGDVGTVVLVADDVQKTITPNFVNETSKSRSL